MGAEQSVEEGIGVDPNITKLEEIKFYLQDKERVVKVSDITPTTSLNFYLRKILELPDTKGMCYEGGCGSCVVVLQNDHGYLSVNSCLIPLLSCNGWKIHTVAGIGNPLTEYHPIQTTLAKFNGTQCGFCSPGMVMNMYVLYKSGSITMEQIEKSFGGNICRCTGYRSILAAFKSFSKDLELVEECPDIEDLRVCRGHESWTKIYKETIKQNFTSTLGDSRWVKVYNLTGLLKVLGSSSSTYRLVGGNTAQGVYKSYKNNVDLYIDVSDVAELKVQNIQTTSCILGAGTTLTKAIEFLNQTAKNNPQFLYLQYLADHVELVANVPVRNRATLAGNLMIKHDHHEFPSDIFLILETVGATLTIVNVGGGEIKLSPLKFLSYNMERQVLKNISFKAFTAQMKYKSFKIMPRAENVHALVNAGFLFNFDQNNVVKSATIVYGNISKNFVHANKTETFLVGKKSFDNSILQQVYQSLDAEVNPDDMPPEPSPQFRKQLAIALFYKAVLAMAPNNKLSPRNKSGATMLERTLSSGKQFFETDESVYPLTEPMPKIEALAQTSGQATYIEDMPNLPHQVFCAMVTAKSPPNSKILQIDAITALQHPDIVTFFSKDDIPGENSFSQIIPPAATAKEEMFCSGTVLYYDQPIGVLVGSTQEAVEEAVSLVKVSYSPPPSKPLLNIRQVLAAGRTDKINQYKIIQRTRKGNDTKKVIKGTFDIYHQYHFHMENQCCRVIPNENGLDVFPSTQWMDHVQLGIAKMLNVSENVITVHLRRCGGAFGGKITRNSLISCIAALVAWKLKRPANMWLPLTTNMAVIGKRFPASADYEVGVNDQGVIQYLDCDFYTDTGVILNGNISSFLEDVLVSTYVSDTFTIRLNNVSTDTHPNTWTRAPGSAESLTLTESIMEHIAYVIGADPVDVRIANFAPDSPLVGYINDMKTWAEYDKLKADVETFNKENRWKKKGLALVPMKFTLLPISPHLSTVSIFHGDGAVQISHGGSEIGQGINTKVAQVCAYKFKIPLEKVSILPSHSFVSPNNAPTGGSITTDGACYATAAACDTLLERMKPYHSDGATWEDVVKKSFENNIKLKATGMYSTSDPAISNYSVYGVAVAEVEVDILTGQYITTRVHINEETGRSLNPIVDVGQVEGAFVMGMGYYLMEEIKFSPEGRILTNNTWTYYPPTARDIPVEILVKFPKNNANPVGVLKSKGTGEPAFCLSTSVLFAIKNAVASARRDAAQSNSKWYKIDGPSTVPNVFTNSLNQWEQYVL